MRKLFLTVDRLLRGGFTRPEELRQGRIGIGIGTLLGGVIVLGISYGIFMGLYGILRPVNPSYLQLIATALKVPLLFLLTLVVTLPSLYVFSVLAGSRLSLFDTLRLLLIGILVSVTLLASFGPVTGFFTLSTESYPFMIVLNVIFFAVGGVAGVALIYKALGAVVETPVTWIIDQEAREERPPPLQGASEKPPEGEPEKGSSDAAPRAGKELVEHPYPDKARLIFIGWATIYGLVGAQMGWILRPFVGDPDLPFQLFRERTSNFFEAFFRSLAELFR